MFHDHLARTSVQRPLVLAALMAFAASSAHAESGSAAASDLSVHINVLGVATLDVDPQIPVGFVNAIDLVSQSGSLPAFDDGGSLVHLSTGTLTSDAEYSPGASMSAAGARVEVQSLDLSALGLLSSSLLSISADVIESQSAVWGFCHVENVQNRDMFDDLTFTNGFDETNLTAGWPGDDGSPDVHLGNLAISILGIVVPDLPIDPPPNTTISLDPLGIVGATLILNEHTLGGDGVNMRSESSNAIHLTLNVAGLITADVVVAHSEGKLDCTM